jgi:hypothetical protein
MEQLGNTPPKHENKENLENQNIQRVFELCPQLNQIGTLEQYNQYLKTIFPESRVQEILWHGTVSENTIEKFDHEYEYNKKGVTFFGEYKQATGYKDTDRGQLYAAVVNIRNPYIQKPLPEDAWATDQLEKEHIDSFRSSGYDAIIGEGIFGDKERLIFSPEQIHILGSPVDVEKFKEFVSQ